MVLVKFILWEWKYGTNAPLPFQESLTDWLLLERVLGHACDAAYGEILFSIILSSKRIRPSTLAVAHSTQLGTGTTLRRKSGIDILPFTLMTVAGAMFSGGMITRKGRYVVVK